MKHISFPSIDQFRNAIKHVRDNAKYHGVPVPSVRFVGTVKMHGTNAGICKNSAGEIWVQSRENIITPEKDNAGFATWAHGKRDVFRQIFDRIEDETGTRDVQIFGEWCGGNIHKGVGLNQLPKMFVVFGVQFGEGGPWLSLDGINHYIPSNGVDIFHIGQFPSWQVIIDMNNPEQMQNELIRLTMEVEARCPVAAQLLGPTAVDPLVGEGIVWVAAEAIDSDLRVDNLRFKVKGEKHAVSKVKTVAPVDVEKMNSLTEFVESVVTINRLNQGLDKLRERGLDVDPKNTGEFIKWVVGDVLKEELDTMSANGFTTKDVTPKIASTARQFFLAQV
jgi:hypothetical protein